ncbi:N-acyl homoserine lactonase family protein [Spirillospora sp. CA-142024]|uniref:N-acyl homoserine lactonase family protein n=1 Tax=Spirillospora sp. CA-142024 TaxID=3240036 RepID=UPI003D91D337
MTVQLYALTCGHLTIPRSFMLEGTEGTIKVPIPAYLIVHPKGTAVFDSGLNTASQTDPLAYAGEFLHAFHDFDFSPGEQITARLTAIDVDPASINLVINSHLHFDHAGGNAQLPNADIAVQRREWTQAHTNDAEYRGYLAADFDTGQTILQLDGEHDVFGDGTVVCIPTYGHTPGHQSLRVRTTTSEYLLAGDACYLQHSLDHLHLPGVIADEDAALDVLHRFRALRDTGTRIMYGHDPDFWTTTPQAPHPLP